MKLQFTNGCRPDFTKISRVIQYLSTQENKKRILHDEIVSALGIPYRQVRSIISIMIGFGLVKSRGNTLTSFGKVISIADPYFQNTDTLWIIHFIVSSNPSLLIWNNIFNYIFPKHDSFSLSFVFENYFKEIKPQYSNQTIKEKLPREIRSVLESYTSTELSRLKILELQGDDNFVHGTTIEISSLVFLYCVLDFRDQFSPGSSAMSVEEISTTKNSPGLVLNLTQYHVRNILEDLNNRNVIRLEQFGNLDQVRFPDSLTKDDILTMIFGTQNA